MYSIQGVSKEANATQDKVVYRICMTIKMPLVLSLSMKLKEKVVLTVIYPEEGFIYVSMPKTSSVIIKFAWTDQRANKGVLYFS